MKCPLCQQQLTPIHDGFIVNPVLRNAVVTGYDCPTQTMIPDLSTISHYTIRSSHEIITIGAYRISSYLAEDHNTMSPGYPPGAPTKASSTILHYQEGKGFLRAVSDCIYIPPDEPHKLLKRLKLLVLFS